MIGTGLSGYLVLLIRLRKYFILCNYIICILGTLVYVRKMALIIDIQFSGHKDL